MVFTAFVVLACASTTTPKYMEISPGELKTYEKPYYKGRQFVTETRLALDLYGSSIRMVDKPSGVYDPKTDNLNERLLKERIESGKVYRVYLTNIGGIFHLDKIDGLMPVEEAQARIDRRNAERIATEEARRQTQEAERQAREKAWEEANRYNPANFIIVPDDFKPASYTKADLFDAVAASEKLSSTPTIWYGMAFYDSIDVVSDVVFVSQSGTDITFRTADNAISRRMKVDSRTGLTAGQRVRIYYTIYRIQNWQIDAIERL
jgi:hypothetical protein